MEPSTTKNEKVETIGQLFNEFIDSANITKLATRRQAKQAYKKIEKPALECISKNTSDENLDYMITVLEHVISNPIGMANGGFNKPLLELPDKVEKAIKQGYISTKDIKKIMVDSFAFEIEIEFLLGADLSGKVPRLIFEKLHAVMFEMRDDDDKKEPILITEEQYRKIKVITIAELIDKIISKSPVSSNFLATIKEKYNKVEEPMLELISRNATNKNLDDIIKVFSGIKHKSAQAMRCLAEDLDKINEKKYITTQDISDIMTSLIKEKTLDSPIALQRASELESVISEFKNNDTGVIILDNYNMKLLSATRNEKIDTIGNLMDEAIDDIMSEVSLGIISANWDHGHIENKEEILQIVKSVQEKFQQVKKPMLELMLRNFVEDDFNKVIETFSFRAAHLDWYTPNIQKNMIDLNKCLDSIIKKQSIATEDLKEVVQEFFTELDMRQEIIDKFSKLKDDKEPITTLINQPQNTTETNKNFQQINK